MISKELKTGSFLFYSNSNEKLKVAIDVENETVWLNQTELAELFGVNKSAVSKHIANIYETKELDPKATVSKMETVQEEGDRKVSRKINYYNLDMILSVGYRVNSQQATKFRKWVSSALKEYLIKGFVLDDDRLKQGKNLFGKDYFKELLEKIRSIRASERRIWQQITDIFAECSIDYDKNSEVTRKFYSNVQNKFHYAIVGKTASEIVYVCANSKKENMGLTTWKNSPNGRILKSDTTVGKNYLQENEIKELERTVSSYFDYVEGLVERGKVFSMEDFSSSIDNFLSFNEYKILDNLGKVSHEQAKNKAHKEYDEFNKKQHIVSDFDEIVKKYNERKNQTENET